MALETFGTSDAVTRKLYDKKLFLEVEKEIYWGKFQSTEMDSIVYVKKDLMNSQGDNIKFYLSNRLTASAKTENDGSLEGKELEGDFNDDSVSLGLLQQAVRWGEDLTVQRSTFILPTEMERLLVMRAAEDVDQLHFDKLVSPVPTKVFYRSSGSVTSTSTAATAKSGIEIDDKINLELIHHAATWCKTGGSRTQPPIERVSVNGKKYYVLLVSPEVAFDLSRDAEYQQAVRDAEKRGPENKIFQDAIAIYKGVIIHEHESVKTGTDAGGSADVAYTECSLLGKNALIAAYGSGMKTVKKSFGYEDSTGVAYKLLVGIKKPKFNSVDYGSVGIYVSHTAI